MSGSFDKIDYSLRPAKYAERRMLRDVFGRVGPFSPPDTYTYVGFGSVWFADFVLFHRALGIRDMVSIECKTKAFQRIRDNSPYQIKLMLGRSEQVLPKLKIERPAFIWLDYDDALDTNMLLDLRTLVGKLRSGSIITVTVRGERAREADQAETDSDDSGRSALSRFVGAFNQSRVPQGTDELDMYGKPFARLSRHMMMNEIQTALVARNRRGQDRWVFEPICSFEYADGVLMTSVVGMLLEEKDRPKFEQCAFELLPFAGSTLDHPFVIDYPLITPREFRMLEAQLPLGAPTYLGVGSVPVRQAKSFEKLYRYLPNYAVLEN